jgi:hypothetical protein
MKGSYRGLIACLLGMFAAVVHAEESKWGDLKLRFVYDGQPPEPKLLAVAAGAPFAPVDETWVVNPKNKGVANVVVYLDLQRGEKLLVHPDLRKPKHSEVKLNILGGRFDPHVTIMRTGQSLVVTNGDPAGHNVVADLFVNHSFNELILAGGAISQIFDSAEPFPMGLRDSLHPHMIGRLLICDHPHAAKSDQDGQVLIGKLPVGKHMFRVWHEAIGTVRALVQAGERLEWKRGLVEVEVKEQGTDLGVFAIK